MIDSRTYQYILGIGMTGVTGSFTLTLPSPSTRYSPMGLFETAPVPLCGKTPSNDSVCFLGGSVCVCVCVCVCDAGQVVNKTTGVCNCTGTQQCTSIGQCLLVINSPEACGNSVNASGNIVLNCGSVTPPEIVITPSAGSVTLTTGCDVAGGCTYTVKSSTTTTSTSGAPGTSEIVNLVGPSTSPTTTTDPVTGVTTTTPPPPVTVVLTGSTWQSTTLTLTNISALVISSGATLSSTSITTGTSGTATNISLAGVTLASVTINSGSRNETTQLTSVTVTAGVSTIVSATVVISQHFSVSATAKVVMVVTLVSISGDVTGGGEVNIRGKAECFNPTGQQRDFQLVLSVVTVVASSPGESKRFLPASAANNNSNNNNNNNKEMRMYQAQQQQGVESSATPCGISPTLISIPAGGVLILNLVCAAGGGAMNSGLTTPVTALKLDDNAKIRVQEADLQQSSVTNPNTPIPVANSCSWNIFTLEFNPAITATVTKAIRILRCVDMKAAQTIPASISGCGGNGCTCAASIVQNATLVVTITCPVTATTSTSTTTSSVVSQTTVLSSSVAAVPVVPAASKSTTASGVTIGVGVGVGVGGAAVLALAGAAFYYGFIRTPPVEAVAPPATTGATDDIPAFPKLEPYTPAVYTSSITAPPSGYPQFTSATYYSPTPAPTPYV